jgi:hypothetical protein
MAEPDTDPRLLIRYICMVFDCYLALTGTTTA